MQPSQVYQQSRFHGARVDEPDSGVTFSEDVMSFQMSMPTLKCYVDVEGYHHPGHPVRVFKDEI